MDKLISICGLDCGKCDAFIATKHNDQALREKTAHLWAELNHAPILPEHINCEGCRAHGAKTFFCSTLCEIRKCALAKSMETCGDCPEMSTCETVGKVHQYTPEALHNLLKKQ